MCLRPSALRARTACPAGAGGCSGGHVERFEVVVIVFELGAPITRNHATEDDFDAFAQQASRMPMAGEGAGGSVRSTRPPETRVCRRGHTLVDRDSICCLDVGELAEPGTASGARRPALQQSLTDVRLAWGSDRGQP